MKLLEDIDELLAYLEDTAHGEEGKRITAMRHRIQTELSNSHKHAVVRGAVTSHCISNDIHNCPFTQTCPECTNPATEPLPAEGFEQNVSEEFECEHYKSLSGHPFYCNQCNKMIT